MATRSVVAELERLQSSSLTAQDRAQGYHELLNQIFSQTGPSLSADAIAYARSILSENIGVIQSRPLLSSFVEKFTKLDHSSVKIEIGEATVQLLSMKIVSYEQQDTDIKLALAEAHEAEDDFTSSAKVLQTIPLDSSQRNVTDDERARIWMRICRCYLEEDDPTNASTFLNKVKQVIFNITDTTTRLTFQLSQARISDYQRNFLDASSSYLALSNETIIDEDERLQALSAAITCAVLAPAGPMRARQLGKLYKDERTVETPERSILEKIFLDRLLVPSEVSAFASGLKEHQLAKTSDGSTVLDKAVLEHNLLAASRVYQNIAFENLGVLLGTDGERAEIYAAGMIESNRLAGSIDQIAGIIYFNSKEGGQDRSVTELRAWEANIQGLAEEVEKVATMLQREEPAFYEKAMMS